MSFLGQSAAGGPRSPKGQHYIANLGAALVRGAWGDAAPGATPSGSPLPWNELIRKWAKHTGGTPSVIHQLRNVSLAALPASNHKRVHRIGSAASSGDGNSHDAAISGSASTSSYVHVPHSSGDPSSSSPTQSPPRRSVDQLKKLGPDVDGEDGAGPGAWAIDSAWVRALDASHAAEVRDGARSLESLIANDKALSADERLSATLTLAYDQYALGEHDAALATYDRFNWSTPATAGVVPGDAAVVDRIRARTLQGICYELCSRPDPDRALKCYLEAVALLDKLQTSPLTTPPYLLPANAPKAPVPSFEPRRELFRSISTALTRAAVIASRTHPHLTLRILRTYHTLASSWPAGFRTTQRHRMLNFYLAALHGSYPAAGAVTPEQHLLVGSTAQRSARVTWRAEVTDALRNGQSMLAGSTAFPRAGETNTAVTEFASKAAAFPDHSDALSREVIHVLWWATTMTFQSQPVLRHLVRHLCQSGDATEARRAFELYVQLVIKARQTRDPESPLKLQRHPTETEEDQAEEDKAEAGGDDEFFDSSSQPDSVEAEIDGDDEFVATLLTGARLLLLQFNDPSEAWRYATLASDVIKLSRVANAKLASQVEECLGVVRQAMATSGTLQNNDPELTTVADAVKRPQYLVQAVNHLRAATTLDPSSSSAHFHLAYAHAAARDIPSATAAVRTALELDSDNVRAWHLLALLLTAVGDWDGALKAGEAGVGVWEADDEAVTADDADKDKAGGAAQTTSSRPLLLANGALAPLLPTPPPHASRSSHLETVIQLRMTLNVIEEKLRGPEDALAHQQELFSFFSQRTERQERRPRSSGTFSSRVPSGRGSIRSAIPDLGGSYVITPPADVQVSPPSPTGTPSITTTGASSSSNATATPRAGVPGMTSMGAAGTRTPRVVSGSPGDSSPASDDGVQRATIGSRKSLLPLPKHLHVPSVARSPSGSGKAHSLRRARSVGPGGTGDRADLVMRSRAASSSTLSIAPTAVHSHYHGARSIAMPPPPPVKRGPPRSPAEERILSDLWLMSAASFRRAGKLEQALVAIEEAETRDPENPAVWVQLGLFHLAVNGPAADAGGAQALAAFTKALLLRTDYPPAVVHLSRLFLAQGDVDLAHSLLSQLTQDGGWDVPEAWYSLATVCERQGRKERARECLLTALRLERSRSCRPLRDALGW